MFDQPSPPPQDDWSAAVRPGDVILFAFPIACATPGEAPKTRPCLVLDVAEIRGRRHLTLAYGTSVDTSANRGEEIHVAAPDEMRPAGVDRPTRFVGARRMVVPPDHAGFATGGGQRSPIIGRLVGEARQRLDGIRTRIAATAAQAAQRRAGRAVIVQRRRLGRPGPGGRGHSRPAGAPSRRR
ncbi:MAG: hypothetical protein EA355_00135 [Rhodobacteraceae bacterium]|nr:MAG: hypothetical protein EA355_00135 [Paracoccaceae bacterium]